MKRFIVYVTFLLSSVFSGHLIISSEARNKLTDSKSKKAAAPVTTGSPANSGSSTIFNVMTYGAKGDGKNDDTKAFVAAWAAACPVGNSQMLVPAGTYLVDYVTFSGKGCKPTITFQLDGKIIAATKTGSLQWLDFTNIAGLTIQGAGIIDGQGAPWWAGKMASPKPTALRVADSTGVSVTGLTIQNAQQAHLKFDNCNGVDVSKITISSPRQQSQHRRDPSTELQNVNLQDSKVGAGDDCVSIQTGCSGIAVSKITCGPSHGISIGSLGKDKSKACVSNVTVTDCTITESDNGVRIKTWPGGSGSVTGVSFKNIHVSDVKTAIVINQNYCDGDKCATDVPGNVAISGITFAGIQGSVTVSPMSLVCGKAIPCTDIALSSISLTGGTIQSNCENAFGSGDACLQQGGGSSYKHSNYNADTC